MKMTEVVAEMKSELQQQRKNNEHHGRLTVM